MSADRPRLLHWMVVTLEKAAGHSDLSLEEQTLISFRLAHYRSEALLTRAEADLLAGELWQARRTLGRIVLGRGFGISTRVQAAAALLAPGAAAAHLARQEGERRESRLARQLSVDRRVR